MAIFQQFVRHVLFPASQWYRGERSMLPYLKEFERTQFLSRDELERLQYQRLRRLLYHAYEHCPFYRERFDQVHMTPSDIRDLKDLNAMPVLEKKEIQESGHRMVSQGWPAHDLLPNQTGGSTGTPLAFFLSRDRKQSRAAATVRHNRWAGLDLGDKCACIWGAPSDRPSSGLRHFLRNALVDRQLFLDAGCLTEARMRSFNDALKRFRPRVILAYARSAVLFASFLRAQGLTPYQPHSIITSAEVLEADDRAVLEAVFGCQVFNRYGSREVSVIASECRAHSGLHTMAEGLYVEVSAPGGAAKEQLGGLGSILVTDLLNFAMPLIRYRIGDLGSWEGGACRCGRGLPRLRHVAGRVTDFLVGADGRLVSGPFLSLYAIGQRPSLGQVQIRQHEAGTVCFRIKRGAAFRDPDDLMYLESVAKRYLGAGTRVECEFVEEIRREPSGKFIVSQSSVTPSFL
jgi:phenylacetate-CoA ligase